MYFSKPTLIGYNSIAGHGVVIHLMDDDLGMGGTDESILRGSAGQRIACGIIAISDPFADFDNFEDI